MASQHDNGSGPASDAVSTVSDIARRIDRITRENQELFSRLLDSETRFRQLAKAVWQVQEDERRRLARELHDGIGQMLTALKNQLERVQQESVEESIAERIADSVEMAAMALHDTRELSRLLRPAVLDDLGLEAALRWMTRTIDKRTGVAVDLDCDLGDTRLDTDVETLVFRLIQEALTNIIKHAGVSSAEVVVRHKPSLLEVRISDQGDGFDPQLQLRSNEDGAGSGLRGMRDRVELFGGRLELHSAPGRGTSLQVMVPLTPLSPKED